MPTDTHYDTARFTYERVAGWLTSRLKIEAATRRMTTRTQIPQQEARSKDGSEEKNGEKKPSLLERFPIIRYVLIAALVAGIVAAVVWYLNYRASGQYLQPTNNAYVRADILTVSQKVGGFPKFLSSMAGYSALQSGKVFFVSGIPALMLSTARACASFRSGWTAAASFGR